MVATEPRCRLFTDFRIDVTDDDATAAMDEFLRSCSANATPPTADDENFAVELTHRAYSPLKDIRLRVSSARI
jgi:hypothetical protein